MITIHPLWLLWNCKKIIDNLIEAAKPQVESTLLAEGKSSDLFLPYRNCLWYVGGDNESGVGEVRCSQRKKLIASSFFIVFKKQFTKQVNYDRMNL
ncbi:hypothetical protein D3C75_186590 [compost metagenome]